MPSSDAPPVAEARRAGPSWTSLVYPAGFVVVVLAMLVSFLAIPDFSPATLAENFHWRKELVQLFSTARMKLGDRLFNSGVISDNGWIMFLGDQSIQEYQHTNQMTKQELNALYESLSRLQDHLRQQGRTFMIVIPPDKNTIYGAQHMPAQIPVLKGESRLDQFEKFMRARSTIQVLDLRAALRDASKTEDVFYHTDSHWNDAGAYVGYVEILKALSVKYPLLQPRPRSDYERLYVMETRDTPPIMGLPQLQEGSWHMRPKFPTPSSKKWIVLPGNAYLGFASAGNPKLPSLLLIQDSFYDIGLYNFLDPHFSQVVAVPTSGDPNIWSADWVSVVPSDIVIIELTERGLNHLVPLLARFDP